MTIPGDLKQRMVDYRARESISQKELADRCKLTLQTIGNIENGRRAGITSLTLAKIENVIGKADGE